MNDNIVPFPKTLKLAQPEIPYLDEEFKPGYVRLWRYFEENKFAVEFTFDDSIVDGKASMYLWRYSDDADDWRWPKGEVCSDEENKALRDMCSRIIFSWPFDNIPTLLVTELLRYKAQLHQTLVKRLMSDRPV